MKGYLGKAFKIAEQSSDEEDGNEVVDDHVVEEDDVGSKKWYNDCVTTEKTVVEEVKFSELEVLRKEAQSLLESAVALNSSKPPKSVSNSDFKWIKTVMVNGTKGDKVAASVILIQDSPLYNLNLLNNMIGMVKVGKKEWSLAAETLQELFLSDLLPPTRKLRFFSQQPLKELKELSGGNENKRKNLLIYWYFESQLKAAYRNFVVSLNQIAHDTVVANKEKAISILFKLLVDNPEQESALLSNIVNKLGDQSHKVGSKVIYVLTKLLQVHPNMREVVLDEVEKLLFRPNIGKRAQYYGVCFLSQFCLSSNDAKIAKKLINVYLCLFKACIKTGEIDSRMMSALLTGVNRAFPFTKDDAAMIFEQINTMYKVVHFGKPNVSIQALSLLYLMSGETGSVSDRFYMVLYKKISEPRLYNSTHHAMFLSLIFKALKSDKRVERVAAFFKRLVQVASYLPAPIVCGILFIISEIISIKKNVLVLEHQSIAGNSVEGYRSDDDDDNGDEHYDDVPSESENEKPVPVVSSKNKPPEGDAKVEVKSEQLKVWRNPEIDPDDRKKVITVYDPYHRNPLYAGGDKTVLLELHKLGNHYHPSVSLFATNILNGERIRYSGDPIQDFALIRFLDKFSFKNPKNLKPENEEKETFSKFGRRKLYSHIIVSRLKGNKLDYLKQDERNVPADEKFIFSYLKDRHSKMPKKEENEESDIESVNSEEFEDMIYKMTGGKDEDIDFMNEAGQLPEKDKVKSKKGESESDDGEEEEEKEDMSDGGSFAEDFDGDEIDSNISDEIMEGSELDESEIPPSLMYLNEKYKKNKKNTFTKKGGKEFSKSKLFASAEEFSELLEQTDYRAGGSEAVSNKDNAGAKQLKWEERREFKRKRQVKNSRKPLKKSCGKAKRKRF